MIRSIRSLQVFVTVAEELHFRRAAERLHMTQPPLSSQIRQLEDTLGVELFCRTTRSVQLTPAGQELKHRAIRFLADLEAMKEAVRSVGQSAGGTLSIGFTASTMFDLLPCLLEAQRAKYPQISVRLKELPSHQLLEHVRTHKLDIALARATLPLMEPDLHYMIATEEAMLLALPAGHPLGRFDAVPIRELNNTPFIGFSEDGSHYFCSLMETMFKKYDVHPQFAQFGVLPTILAFVQARLGVALVPESMARLQTQEIIYRPILDVREIEAVPLYCVWSKGGVTEIINSFINVMADYRARAAHSSPMPRKPNLIDRIISDAIAL